MKLNIIKVSAVVVSFAVIGIAAGLLSSNSTSGYPQYNGKPLYTSSTMKMYDDSTPEKVIGTSDYVFVAKINKISRTDYKNKQQVRTGLITKNTSNPCTIYEIDVIENIKGSLKTDEPIEFLQFGGLNENGKSYTFLEDGAFFNTGEYYILMANTWGSRVGETIEASYKNRIISLGDSYDPSSDLVSQYKTAYQNQEVPTGYTNVMSKFDNNYQK